MTASVIYKGQLRCECTHLQSGTVIETDAPTDNRGKGERFSPTDTLCVALATCIVTTMALKATDMGIELANIHSPHRREVLADFKKRKRSSWRDAVLEMAELTMIDWKEWKRESSS